jgi:hypothetical protein
VYLCRHVSEFGIQHETEGATGEGPGTGAGAGASSSFILVHTYRLVMPAKTSWSTHVLQPQPCMSKRGEESWLWSCGCKPKATRPGRRTSTFDLPVADHQPCPRADAEASVPFVANVACADWQGQPASQRATDRQDTKRDYSGER